MPSCAAGAGRKPGRGTAEKGGGSRKFMKKTAMKKKGYLFTFLCLFCLFCLAPLRAQAAGAQLGRINNLYVTGFFGDTVSEQKINWQKDGSDYCLCLPSGSSLEQIRLWFEGDPADGYLMLDGRTVKSGDTIDLSGAESTLTLSLSGSEQKLRIVRSANIPSMFIATESGSLSAIHANKEYKEPGELTVVKADSTIDYAGSLKHIKGRGNATWGYAKKPYNIKLNKAADLLGMGKEKGWCLLANYTDRSLLRNRIVYDLAEEVGIPFTMDSRNIDLYINGNYMGSYLLTEKIEIGENRVDIVDLEGATEDVNDAELETYSRGGSNGWAAGTQKWVNIPNDPEDITGGYLLEVELNDRYAAEVSGFVTAGRQSVVIKYPEFASENQVKYISNFYQEMEDAVYSETGYNSLGKHFSEYIDIESVARMYVLQEFSMNLDTGITSFYFYKDSDLTGDGRIHAAPAWDFDVALGNYYSRNGVNLTDPTQWWARIAQIYNIGGLNILAQAVSHTEVMEKAAKIWEQEFVPAVKVLLGEETDHQASKIKSLFEYEEETAPSAAMNFIQWAGLMENPSAYGLVQTGTTYEANIAYLESFISRRRDFLDEGLYDLTHPPVWEIGEDTRLKAAEKILSSVILKAEMTTDEGGGQNLGYCDAGAYAEYNINVKDTGIYDVSARIASDQGGGAFALIVDGEALTAFQAVRTGGWQNWVTLDAQTVRLAAGGHRLRIEYTESGSNLNWLQFTLREKEEPPVDTNVAREQLQELYNAYTELDTAPYTPESVEVLKNALTEAKEVLGNADADAAMIDAAVGNLMGAFGSLEHKVQRLHLEVAIQVAKRLLEKPDDYADVTKLAKAVEDGSKVLEEKNASQEEVNEAAYQILLELASLKFDKSALLELTEAAEKLIDSGKYTDESIGSLKTALADAKAVLDDPASDPERINSASAALVYAVAELKLENNKAALKAMIEKAEQLLADRDAYVESTIAGLATVLETAREVYADRKASQTAIDDITRTLTREAAKARRIGDVDGNGTVDTGDSAMVLMAAAEFDNLSAEQQLCGDVNGDGAVDTADAAMILRYASELLNAL